MDWQLCLNFFSVLFQEKPPKSPVYAVINKTAKVKTAHNNKQQQQQQQQQPNYCNLAPNLGEVISTVQPKGESDFRDIDPLYQNLASMFFFLSYVFDHAFMVQYFFLWVP